MVTRFGMGAQGVAHAGCDAAEISRRRSRRAVNDLLEDSLFAARALLQTSQPLLEAIAAELIDEETRDRQSTRRAAPGASSLLTDVPSGVRARNPSAAHRERRRSYSVNVDE